MKKKKQKRERYKLGGKKGKDKKLERYRFGGKEGNLEGTNWKARTRRNLKGTSSEARTRREKIVLRRKLKGILAYC